MLVENGLEAVHAFRAARFDAILMDMQMPVMDGLTAIREIRQIESELGLPRTPIAVLSANAMADHVEAAMTAGADLHVAKPVKPATLIEALERLLTESSRPDPSSSSADGMPPDREAMTSMGEGGLWRARRKVECVLENCRKLRPRSAGRDCPPG